MNKKIVQIDLDGVLNTYSGNFDKEVIPSIKDGAKEFLEKLSNDYRIEIFTVRDKELTEKWIEENGINHLIENVTDTKNPFATLILDDRALTFQGDYKETYSKIKNFKPYWK